MTGILMRVCSAVCALALSLALAGCGHATDAQMTDITGVMPPLAFHMTRANDGVSVDAQAYRGKVVALYFGYTHCPDECPTTLANLSTLLQRLGAEAPNVRVLFVTVDPARDTAPALKSYVQAFAPQIDGLRGSVDDVATLARRYRVLYSVTPQSPGHSYEVTHSASVFFFDRNGRARFVTMETGDAVAITKLISALLQHS